MPTNRHWKMQTRILLCSRKERQKKQRKPQQREQQRQPRKQSLPKKKKKPRLSRVPKPRLPCMLLQQQRKKHLRNQLCNNKHNHLFPNHPPQADGFLNAKVYPREKTAFPLCDSTVFRYSFLPVRLYKSFVQAEPELQQQPELLRAHRQHAQQRCFSHDGALDTVGLVCECSADFCEQQNTAFGICRHGSYRRLPKGIG